MDQKLFSKKLLPAVTLSDADSAVAVAEALLEAGVDIMEITFRTEATSAAIRAISKEYPEMNIGAGTILSRDQVKIARDAGAKFGLSPGYNEKVVEEAIKLNFRFIPGVLTSSEIERAMERKLNLLKLFPVNCLGGPAYVKSLQGPYLHTGLRLVPMGGISLKNLADYVDLPVVAALGGSWIVPADRVEKREFRKISDIARKSLAVIDEKMSTG